MGDLIPTLVPFDLDMLAALDAATEAASASVPPDGCSSPATRRSTVVLPQPDGPSSATKAPGATSSEIRVNACTPLAKRLSTVVSEMASDMGGDCHTGRRLPRLPHRLAPSRVFWLRAVARRCGGGPTPVNLHAGDLGAPWVRGRHLAAEELRTRAMTQVRAHAPASQRAFAQK